MDSALSALALFTFATSITPGSNNLMLMTSGARFGFRATLPHWLGVSSGLVLMILALGAGLSNVLNATPSLRIALQIAGAAYSLWLAWRVANAGRLEDRTATARPMKFLEAVAFQGANPKVWAMALTIVSVYARGGAFREVAEAGTLAGAVNFPCVGLWAAVGRPLRVLAERRDRYTLLNRGLAILIVLSLAPLVFER